MNFKDLFFKYSTENVIIRSLFIANSRPINDYEESAQEQDDYDQNLLKLEESLNKEQERFIETYIKPNSSFNEHKHTYGNTTSSNYVFANLLAHYDSSYIFIELSKR